MVDVSSPELGICGKLRNPLENELEVADNVIKHVLRVILEDFGLGFWQRQSEVVSLFQVFHSPYESHTRMVSPEHSPSLKQFAA